MLSFALALDVKTSIISIWHSRSGFIIHKSESRKPTSLRLREVIGDSSWVCASKAWATQENMAGIHTGINTAAYINIKSRLERILLPKKKKKNAACRKSSSKLVNIYVNYFTGCVGSHQFIWLRLY